MIRIVDETGEDFRSLIEQDFRAIDPSRDYNDVILDWLHYKARQIPRRPRQVIKSIEIQTKETSYPAIEEIAGAFRSGESLTPWLSNTIRHRKTDPHADMMFNDWQILHFHLGRIFVRPDEISRTRDLLFAFVHAERVVLLDIQPHGAWALTKLLEILLLISPADMERTELKGVLGLSHNPSDEEIFALRRSGITPMIQIGDRVFSPPGFGVTSSKHATRFVLYRQNFRRQLNHLKECINKNELSYRFTNQLAQNIGLPVKLGIRWVAGSAIIYDKNRDLDFMTMPVLA